MTLQYYLHSEDCRDDAGFEVVSSLLTFAGALRSQERDLTSELARPTGPRPT